MMVLLFSNKPLTLCYQVLTGGDGSSLFRGCSSGLTNPCCLPWSDVSQLVVPEGQFLINSYKWSTLSVAMTASSHSPRLRAQPCLPSQTLKWMVVPPEKEQRVLKVPTLLHSWNNVLINFHDPEHKMHFSIRPVKPRTSEEKVFEVFHT